MPDDEVPKTTEEDEYELLPHREIEDLKEELSKLKEFEIAPSKRLQVSLLELNTKLDKLITIFEDATHELRIEEGGLSFTEKMKPLLEKMNKILEQNSEIASGILALADMVKELKEGKEEAQREEIPVPAFAKQPQMPPMGVPGSMGASGPMGAPGMMAPPRQMPPPPMGGPMGAPGMMPPGVPPGLPMPPVPRRRTFGI